LRTKCLRFNDANIFYKTLIFTLKELTLLKSEFPNKPGIYQGEGPQMRGFNKAVITNYGHGGGLSMGFAFLNDIYLLENGNKCHSYQV
jgi:hypothetical protein